MCALRDGAPSTSGESSALFVTPAPSSAGHETSHPQETSLGAADSNDELYRCTPNPHPRQPPRPNATTLRATELTARRHRLPSQTPSPHPHQVHPPPQRHGPFLETSSSAPSEQLSNSGRQGNIPQTERTTTQNLPPLIPQHRNLFYTPPPQNQNAPTPRRTKQSPPLWQGPAREASEALTQSSFPGFVQEVGDESTNLEDTEMVDAPAARREIPSSSPLSSLSPTPEIPERDWEIVRIEETRVKDGVRERKIAWKATRHSRAIMRMQPHGEVVLNVAGIRWGGMREQTVEPGEVDDDGMVRVYWATTWHPDWDLPKELVAMWERKYGEDEGAKEDKQQPRWWVWPEQTEECLPPESEPDPGERELMPQTEEETFTLEPGKDYTISFLEDRRAALLLPEPDHGIPESTIIRFLNMHVRNRLRVSESFEEHEFRSNTLSVRTALVYIFGTAMIRPCIHCRETDGPYPRCVTWLTELGGACCNCAFARRGTECEYHLTVRWFKAPKLAPDDDAMEVDDDDAAPPPSDPPSVPSSSSTSSSSSHPESARPRGSQHSSVVGAPGKDNSSVDSDDVPDRGGQDRGSSSTAGRQHSRHTPAQTKHSFNQNRSRSRGKRPARQRSNSDSSIKSEEFDASPEGTSVFHHEDCLPPPAPCRDRTCGRFVNPQSHRVFRGDSFSKGQATDAQVNFILSCCTCTNTEALQQAWDEFRRSEERKGLPPRHESRERYFSHDCWRILNQLVGWCPEKWNFEGEIDLTDD